MILNKKKVKEIDPDEIYLNNKELYSGDDDALSFGFNTRTKKWLIANEEQYGEGHYELFDDYYEDVFINHGRIWVNSKVIIFWSYPENINFFNSFIKELKQRLNQKIWNNGWYIITFEMDSDLGYQIAKDILPIEEYVGSDNVPEEKYELHLLNAKEKSKRMKKLGYKPKISKFKKWQKPFESKYINGFSNFIYNKKLNK